MPLSLNALAKDVADLTVRIGEDTVELTFHPNAVTPEVEAEMVAISKTAADGQGMELARLLEEILVAWDIVEDEADTDPIPCTVEGIARVPIAVLGEIAKAIGEAMVVPGKTSRSGRRRR